MKEYIIIEPWHHVGEHRGQPVRASENLRLLIEMFTNYRCNVLPMWKEGFMTMNELRNRAYQAEGVFLEGGAISANDPSKFTKSFTRGNMVKLIADFLIDGVPFSSICLSHQMTAYALEFLLRRATIEMVASGDEELKELANEISLTGNTLPILKGYGKVCDGWESINFTVAKNEDATLTLKKLHPYVGVGNEHIPNKIRETYKPYASYHKGIIDQFIAEDIEVEAFHADEVNEEAIKFFCWGFASIHKLLATKNNTFEFLERLPLGVKITSSIKDDDGNMLTEVASMAIHFNNRVIETYQFHPELDSTLKTVSDNWLPKLLDDGTKLIKHVILDVDTHERQSIKS